MGNSKRNRYDMEVQILNDSEFKKWLSKFISEIVKILDFKSLSLSFKICEI